MPDEKKDEHVGHSFGKATTPERSWPEGLQRELTTADLRGDFLDQMGDTFDRVAETLGERPRPELVLAAFSYTLDGLLKRIATTDEHLGEEPELLDLLQRAIRTLWYRVKKTESRVRKVFNALDLLLKNPTLALRTIKADELRRHLEATSDMDEVELGLRLGDLSSRAHDVRNALSPIVSTSSMLAFKLRKDQAAPVAERVVKPDEVSRLMAFAKPALARARTVLLREESEKMTVRELIQTLRLHLHGLNLQLKSTLSGDSLSDFCTDLSSGLSSQDLYRLLFNLADNAKKHGAAKVISLSFLKHEDRLEIRIKDDGTGFTRDPLSAKEASEAGHGYGVDGCKRLCEAAGGTLTAGPIGQPEAEFIISLPLNPSADPR